MSSRIGWKGLNLIIHSFSLKLHFLRKNDNFCNKTSTLCVTTSPSPPPPPRVQYNWSIDALMCRSTVGMKHTCYGVGDGCVLLTALDDGQASTKFLAPAARTCKRLPLAQQQVAGPLKFKVKVTV